MSAPCEWTSGSEILCGGVSSGSSSNSSGVIRHHAQSCCAWHRLSSRDAHTTRHQQEPQLIRCPGHRLPHRSGTSETEVGIVTRRCSAIYALQGERRREIRKPVTPPHPPIGGPHMHMCKEGMCATKAKNGFSKAAASTAVASAQEVCLTHRVGAPSMRYPRVDTPARRRETGSREVQATGAAQAKPSSRGDARAVERARTGGVKSPDRKASFPRSAGRRESRTNAQRLRLRFGAIDSLPGGPLYWIPEGTTC
jgi:hypothetical protein